MLKQIAKNLIWAVLLTAFTYVIAKDHGGPKQWAESIGLVVAGLTGLDLLDGKLKRQKPKAEEDDNPGETM